MLRNPLSIAGVSFFTGWMIFMTPHNSNGIMKAVFSMGFNRSTCEIAHEVADSGKVYFGRRMSSFYFGVVLFSLMFV